MPAFLAVTNTQAGNDQRHRDERGTRRHGAPPRCAVLLGCRPARSAWRAAAAAGRPAVPQALGSYAQKAARIERLARRIATDVLGGPEDADAAARAAASRRRTWRPTWCASSPSCRARWAASTRAKPANRKPCGRRSITTTSRSASRPRRRRRTDALARRGDDAGRACRSPTSSTRSSACSWRASSRPGSRDPFGLRRQAHGVLRILLDLKTLTGHDVRPALGRAARCGAEYGTASQHQRPAHPPVRTADASRRLEAFVRERLGFALQQRGGRRATCARSWARAPLADLRPADLELNLRELAAFRTPSRSASWRRRSSASATSRANCRRARTPAAICAPRSRSPRNTRCSTKSNGARRSLPTPRRADATSRRLRGSGGLRAGGGAVLQGSPGDGRGPRPARGATAAHEAVGAVDSAVGRYFGNRSIGVVNYG